MNRLRWRVIVYGLGIALLVVVACAARAQVSGAWWAAVGFGAALLFCDMVSCAVEEIGC